MSDDTPQPLTADQLSQLQSLQKQQADYMQSVTEAADNAVKALVNGAEFKALYPLAETANAAAPKNTELQYMVNMMDRLITKYQTVA